MPVFDERRSVSLADALRKIPGPGGERFANVFEHGTLQIEIYHPVRVDPQSPHARDEAYIVVRGHGHFICGEKREAFAAGDFLFAPAGVEHRFVDFSENLTIWVIFYGPDGGEHPEGH